MKLLACISLLFAQTALAQPLVLSKPDTVVDGYIEAKRNKHEIYVNHEQIPKPNMM